MLTSALGFVFWTLATHNYPASTVGTFSTVTGGTGLLAAIAALGLQNTMIRHVVGADNPRQLVAVAVTAISTAGSALCVVILLGLGPHLPAALDLQQHGRMTALVTLLVIFTAVSGLVDAGLIAIRSTLTVLITNIVGSITKIVTLLLLTNLHSFGLLFSYSLALALSTVPATVILYRRIDGRLGGFNSFLILRRYLSLTSGNYLATILGILPSSIIPFEVLIIRGASDTARFAIAGMLAGFLTVIPSTIGQVLFAEASRKGAQLGQNLSKALRGIYGLLLPAVAITIPAAPFLLSLFGPGYARQATGCLRVFALVTLLMGGTYLVDSILIARDRVAAYVFINGANAALVLICVGILLPYGLTAAASGEGIAQGASLLLGLGLLATGKAGRHHSKARIVAAANVSQEAQELGVEPFELQIRELLATWPTMPTSLIAERIGWDQSIHILLDRVSELRSVYPRSSRYMSRSEYAAGEIAQCGLWFPPVEVPVKSGQTRSQWDLPILTLITGYSRWLSTILIHSTEPEDIIDGWWQLMRRLGSVPKVLVWADGALGARSDRDADLTGRCIAFCHSIGARLVIGRSAAPETTALVERAHVYLERSFLAKRTFASPEDLDEQLNDWVYTANTRHREPPRRSPAEFIGAERQAMMALPPKPPRTGWHLVLEVGDSPFIYFDANAYSIHPAAVHSLVNLYADNRRIMVLLDGNIVANHERSWGYGQTIVAPGTPGQLH